MIYVIDEEGNPVVLLREELTEMRARQICNRCLGSCLRPEDEDPEDLFFTALQRMDPASLTRAYEVII